METPSYIYDATEGGTVVGESTQYREDEDYDDSMSYDWIVTLVKYMDKHKLQERWKDSEEMEIPIYE
jgi:hypothetical protein